MPNHLDFIKHLGLNAHSLSCEFSLVADNFARGFGVTVADSLVIARKLLEAFQCTLSR